VGTQISVMNDASQTEPNIGIFDIGLKRAKSDIMTVLGLSFFILFLPISRRHPTLAYSAVDLNVDIVPDPTSEEQPNCPAKFSPISD
jgi:hypothetical protein